jgi:hypothetical protein
MHCAVVHEHTLLGCLVTGSLAPLQRAHKQQQQLQQQQQQVAADEPPGSVADDDTEADDTEAGGSVIDDTDMSEGGEEQPGQEQWAPQAAHPLRLPHVQQEQGPEEEQHAGQEQGRSSRAAKRSAGVARGCLVWRQLGCSCWSARGRGSC